MGSLARALHVPPFDIILDNLAALTAVDASAHELPGRISGRSSLRGTERTVCVCSSRPVGLVLKAPAWASERHGILTPAVRV